jgi:hypothetical protein
MGHSRQTSFIGGVAWKKLDPGLYSVTHRLPTPYFISWHENDWSYWWGQVGFGNLDHRFPGEQLFRQQRWRYAGSSDACFIVEVTDKDKNVPPDTPPQIKIPADIAEAYCGDGLHHQMNRLFNVIWRGE